MHGAMRIVVSVWLLASAASCGTPSLLITPVSNSNRLEEVTLQGGRGWSAPKIAIVEVEGMLLNARSGGFLQPQENKVSLFVQQLNVAARDPRVKAVVLRINSPGGTVTASDIMYQTVLRFRASTKKPVVASLQDVSASGAYYVACAADRIVAHPTSVVGSIGVLFETFDISAGMAKLGIRNEPIKSAPLKDLASPFHPLSSEERAVMQGMVDEYFARFVEIVRANRPIRDEASLKLVTDGRVFTGQQAAALGLADSTGMLSDAIALAKQLGDASGAAVVMYRRPYGYGGSIYASSPTPQPAANVLALDLPGADQVVAPGFYYLWRPQP
jgi:protease-4